MKQVDEKVIQSLNRILSMKPILFTGSGFSRGATNGKGDSIPIGGELKETIITDLLKVQANSDLHKELMQASLSDVCTYATNEISSQKLKDYLILIFKDCVPDEFHRVIAKFSWKKIYTTNIDDLMENAAGPNDLTVQNTNRQFSFTQANSIEYIKLHGCVRNASGDIVFSKRDYIDSMMKSTDYRFSSFANDMQTENFVFIGTSFDEIDLDYYLQLFKHNSNTSVHGKAFFITPNPSAIFVSKVRSAGGEIIEWTAEEFAKHLIMIQSSPNTISSSVSRDILGYLNVNKLFDKKKTLNNHRSNLYFGQFPNWLDVFYDWDFINPQIEHLYDLIQNQLEKSVTHVAVVSLHGKALSGKSTYLKRIGFKLMKDGFQVYEFVGRRMDYYYFYKMCQAQSEGDVALLIDNGSFYYAAIRSLVNLFSRSNKKLVVITSSREYHHNRKRYHLSADSFFMEEAITGEIVASDGSGDDHSFARNIEKKLDEKGYLGNLKVKSVEDRLHYIERINDVGTLMYNFTQSPTFRTRIISTYQSAESNVSSQTKDFLCLLAIFQKLDLPYFPLELLGLWMANDYSQIMEESGDFVKNINMLNAVELRNNILTKTLLAERSPSQKVTLIKEILCLVSPQVSESVHSYWNEIQSVLMKGKALRGKLKISNGYVKRMLTEIKNYYNDDYNYWIQVGIAEQSDGEYGKALNHFRQAEAISPNSYLVQNAIARNYLRQANSIKDQQEATVYFQEGEKEMLDLIRKRDEFQVKAFSTHCYLFEKIKFVKSHHIDIQKKELELMFSLLRNIVDRDPNDPMARHIKNVFAQFIKESTTAANLKIRELDELRFLKSNDNYTIEESYEILDELDIN